MPATAAALSRVNIGEVVLTYLPDGELCIDPARVYDGAEADLFDVNSHLLDRDGLLVISLGSILIESGGIRALVDLAWGPSSVDLPTVASHHSRGHITGGRLIESLAKCGLTPADIDVVLFTHLHRDHTGWLSADADGTGPTFHNARHLVAEAEWKYWTDSARGSFAPAISELSSLSARLDWLCDGESLIPGVNAMMTAGHTPGHCSFVISSGNERAIIVGDTLHCPVEISHPELALMADVDPHAARATREALDRELATPGVMTVGAHFPETAFGRVVTGLRGRALEQVPGAFVAST
jgi:glyoxylase-like metal-dependent hydrolase (beta-lactamase superfamily II)